MKNPLVILYTSLPLVGLFFSPVVLPLGGRCHGIGDIRFLLNNSTTDLASTSTIFSNSNEGQRHENYIKYYNIIKLL